MSKDQNVLSISIIVPVFNEAQTLKPLYYQICDVLSTIGVPYEIIFVDDGSTDGSFAVMEELYHTHQEMMTTEEPLPNDSSREFEADSSPAQYDRHPTDRNASSDDIVKSSPTSQVIVIQFRHNMGKAAALATGFAHATGDIVITMDADLQDDPHEIPQFLAKLEEGYDLVSGWKVHRQDPWSKVLLSRIFNRVVCLCTHLSLHDINCGFKAYRREVIQDLQVYGDRHRYLPILAHQNGYRVTEVPVKHHPRKFGKSKYGLGRIPRGLFDLLTILFLNRYLKRPLHFFGSLGLICLIGGMGINTYLAVLWLIQKGIGFRPLLMLGVLLMILGMQFLSIGLLGELFTNAFERIDRHYPIKTVLRQKTPPSSCKNGGS